MSLEYISYRVDSDSAIKGKGKGKRKGKEREKDPFFWNIYRRYILFSLGEERKKKNWKKK